jgi:hypothetical protein
MSSRPLLCVTSGKARGRVAAFVGVDGKCCSACGGNVVGLIWVGGGPQEGEARTVAAFEEDPYGCGGELLAKKLGRDPFAVSDGPRLCPVLKEAGLCRAAASACALRGPGPVLCAAQVGPIPPARCPEMRSLMTYCGPGMFGGRLPWIQ